VSTDRVVRDGMVAVVRTGAHGAPWSLWTDDRDEAERMLFHPSIVEWVEGGGEFDDWPEGLTDYGPRGNLRVEWVPLGVEFYVTEYDGWEKIVRSDEIEWITA
jgi:hypothetical protein